MKTRAQRFKAAGYLCSMLPMALVVAGLAMNMTWLAVVFFFAVLPIVRPFVGDDKNTYIEKHAAGRLLRSYLISVPRIYVGAWLILLGWSLHVLATVEMGNVAWAGFFLSMWVVNSLNMCMAHELVHSQSSLDKFLGRVLSSTCGYFHFSDEHKSHHATNGSDEYSDSAPASMSIYEYAIRRYAGTFRSAWDWEIAAQMRKKRSWVWNRVVWSAGISLGVLCAHGYAAGTMGVLFFVGQVLATAFSVQGITFLQHWAMRESSNGAFGRFGFAWEDGCAMQACVTMNHAFHSQHHLRPGLRYFELQGTPGSPSLPASYPVMFMLALFPWLFKKTMSAQLAKWLSSLESGSKWDGDTRCASPRDIKALIRDVAD